MGQKDIGPFVSLVKDFCIKVSGYATTVIIVLFRLTNFLKKQNKRQSDDYVY
jgi:hypothetical protein